MKKNGKIASREKGENSATKLQLIIVVLRLAISVLALVTEIVLLIKA